MYTDEELVEEFGSMNVEKINQVKEDVKNNIFNKKDLMYLLYCFYNAYEGVAGFCCENGLISAKYNILIEYLQLLDHDIDTNTLMECGECEPIATNISIIEDLYTLEF
mgnify:CR=1 FL=1